MGAAPWEMEGGRWIIVTQKSDLKGKILLRGTNVDDMIVSHQNPGSDNF